MAIQALLSGSWTFAVVTALLALLWPAVLALRTWRYRVTFIADAV